MPRLWQDSVRVLDQGVSDGVFPGAAALVARGDNILFEHACGSLGLSPQRDAAATPETIWDLASLTKPLVTAALALVFVDHGRLHLDDRVADLLPAFGHGGDPRRLSVTVRHLLHHDSGLPAYRRLFETLPPAGSPAPTDRRRALLEAAMTEPLERDPGAESVYSDLGFLVLGALLEGIGGHRIDELARRYLFEPLELEGAWFVDREAARPFPLERSAATGLCPWRGHVVHGEVQDENAYAMGGVAPHAGLFATTRGVHALALEWERASRNEGRILRGRVVRHAWARTSGRAASTWALGWDTPSVGTSSAGSRISDLALGHLGYTGTSLWIDRRRSVHVVLLTNRVASDKKGDGIRALRPRFHDAVFAAIDDDRYRTRASTN